MKRQYSKQYLLLALGLVSMAAAAPRAFADECGGDFNGWICGDGYGMYGDPGSTSNSGGGGWDMSTPLPANNTFWAASDPSTDSPVDLSANLPTNVNLPSAPSSVASIPPPVVAMPDPTPPSNPVMTAMDPLPPMPSFSDGGSVTGPGGSAVNGPANPIQTVSTVPSAVGLQLVGSSVNSTVSNNGVANFSMNVAFQDPTNAQTSNQTLSASDSWTPNTATQLGMAESCPGGNCGPILQSEAVPEGAAARIAYTAGQILFEQGGSRLAAIGAASLRLFGSQSWYNVWREAQGILEGWGYDVIHEAGKTPIAPK